LQVVKNISIYKANRESNNAVIMRLYKGDAGGRSSQQGIQLRRDNIFMIEVAIHQNADHNDPCE
jgi:hypothetical protein